MPQSTVPLHPSEYEPQWFMSHGMQLPTTIPAFAHAFRGTQLLEPPDPLAPPELEPPELEPPELEPPSALPPLALAPPADWPPVAVAPPPPELEPALAAPLTPPSVAPPALVPPSPKASDPPCAELPLPADPPVASVPPAGAEPPAVTCAPPAPGGAANSFPTLDPHPTARSKKPKNPRIVPHGKARPRRAPHCRGVQRCLDQVFVRRFGATLGGDRFTISGFGLDCVPAAASASRQSRSHASRSAASGVGPLPATTSSPRSRHRCAVVAEATHERSGARLPATRDNHRALREQGRRASWVLAQEALRSDHLKRVGADVLDKLHDQRLRRGGGLIVGAFALTVGCDAAAAQHQERDQERENHFQLGHSVLLSVEGTVRDCTAP